MTKLKTRKDPIRYKIDLKILRFKALAKISMRKKQKIKFSGHNLYEKAKLQILQTNHGFLD